MVKKESRVYSRAVFAGFRQGVTNQNPHHALLRIEGVKDKETAKWYIGKKAAYVYKTTKAHKKGDKTTKKRSIRGKIVATHGGNGIVRATFKPNLPSQAMGKMIRVMLYPFRPPVSA